MEERAELEKEAALRGEVSKCLTTAVACVAKIESQLQLKVLGKELELLKTKCDEMHPVEVKVLSKQSSSNMRLLQSKGSFLKRKDSVRNLEEDIVSPLFRQSVDTMSANELKILIHDHESKLQILKVCFGLLPPPPPPTAQEVEAKLNAILKKSKHEAKKKIEEELEMERKLIESRCSVSILLRYKGNYEVTATAIINGTLLQQAPDLPDQNAAPPPPDPAKLLLNRLLAAKKVKDEEPRFEEGGVLWIPLDSPLVAFSEREGEGEGDLEAGKQETTLGRARICVRVHVIEREKKTKLAINWRVEVVEGDGAEWWVRGSSGEGVRKVTGDDDGEEGMRLEVCWMGREVGLLDWAPYRLGVVVDEEGETDAPRQTRIVRGSLGNIWRPLYHPTKGARGVRKAVTHGRGHDGAVIKKFVMVASDKIAGTNVMRVKYDASKLTVEEKAEDVGLLSPRTQHRAKLKNLLKSAGVATMISLSLSNNSEEK